MERSSKIGVALAICERLFSCVFVMEKTMIMIE